MWLAVPSSCLRSLNFILLPLEMKLFKRSFFCVLLTAPCLSDHLSGQCQIGRPSSRSRFGSESTFIYVDEGKMYARHNDYLLLGRAAVVMTKDTAFARRTLALQSAKFNSPVGWTAARSSFGSVGRVIELPLRSIHGVFSGRSEASGLPVAFAVRDDSSAFSTSTLWSSVISGAQSLGEKHLKQVVGNWTPAYSDYTIDRGELSAVTVLTNRQHYPIVIYDVKGDFVRVDTIALGGGGMPATPRVDRAGERAIVAYQQTIDGSGFARSILISDRRNKQWSKPRVVVHLKSGAIGDIRLVSNRSGGVTLFWTESASADDATKPSTLRFMHSTNDGQTWLPPESVGVNLSHGQFTVEKSRDAANVFLPLVTVRNDIAILLLRGNRVWTTEVPLNDEVIGTPNLTMDPVRNELWLSYGTRHVRFGTLMTWFQKFPFKCDK